MIEDKYPKITKEEMIEQIKLNPTTPTSLKWMQLTGIKILTEEQIANEYKTLLLLKRSGEATELLVKEIKAREHIYTTRDDLKSEVWIYKEGIYVPQGKSYIKEWMRKLLKEIYTEHKANEVIAKIETDTYIEPDYFFNHNQIDLICLENGILNLKTRELKPYNPEIIFFNKQPIKFDPFAGCPNIIKHFETVLKNKEDVPVIQELFGYCLLKDYMFEKAFMFTGSGRNGKSKTIEILKRFVGVKNCSSVTLQELSNTFSKVELFNKMVNLAGDISNETIKDASWFKGLSGRDTIGADRKFLNKLYFTNYSKLIFSANELPKTYDISPAFWNRWIILEFPYTFKSQKEIDSMPTSERLNVKLMDEEIINKITTEEEMSGLLNWSLDGLDNLLKQRDFSYSKSVNDVRDFWIRKSDSFMAFCLDELDFDNGESFIEKKELRKAYNDYCKFHKIKSQGDKSIANSLNIHFGITEDRKWVDSEQKHVWEGVCFKSKLNSENKISQGFHDFSNRIGKKNSLYQIENGGNLATPFLLSTRDDLASITWFDVEMILKEKSAKEIEIDTLISYGVSEKLIDQWKSEGLIYESRAGWVKLL